LNVLTKKDPLFLPLIDEVLNIVAIKDLYSFLDGFSGWGAFIFMVMPFGLCNAPTMFLQSIMEASENFIRDFMQVFLDDFSIYGVTSDHLNMLNKCFQRC
jgi:hypothetical protein